MKRILALMLCMLLALAIIVSCSAEKEPAQQGAGGHAEEAADSTRMDAATPDSTMDDSMMTEQMETEGEGE